MGHTRLCVSYIQQHVCRSGYQFCSPYLISGLVPSLHLCCQRPHLHPQREMCMFQTFSKARHQVIANRTCVLLKTLKCLHTSSSYSSKSMKRALKHSISWCQIKLAFFFILFYLLYLSVCMLLCVQCVGKPKVLPPL